MSSKKFSSDADSTLYVNKEEINPTSTTLIIQIKNNESAAWERFMKLYEPLIRYWCRKQGGILTRSDRQDITQKVFIKVSKAITGFDEKKEDRSLRAWLRTITDNTIIDTLKKINQQKNVNRLMSDTGHFKEPYNLPATSTELSEDPNEKIILLRQVLKLVKPKIKPEHWDILNLYINMDKTSYEVADMMNMKPDTVRKIKNRLLNHLRDIYNDLDRNEKMPFD